jgi:phosphoribosyl 1,2-cyclic phosphodiesterase
VRITVLGSGSTGNAILITAGGTRVLIDAGLSAREIIRRMALASEDATQLDGIVVTHEHGDHSGGLRVLLKNVRCQVYMSVKTKHAYIREQRNSNSEESRRRANALRDRVEEIETSACFTIGRIDFHPFTVPHDAVDNFGFTATHAGVSIAALMDFGHITTLIRERLRGAAAVAIESNHSRDMLKACEFYPWELKQRILSRVGHLSNEDVAEWLQDGFDGVAQYIILTHLSQQANNPYVAEISAVSALRARAPLFSDQYKVMLSHPREPTPWVEV